MRFGLFLGVRSYEIAQRDRADKISIYTNLQGALKARDLRSNDKCHQGSVLPEVPGGIFHLQARRECSGGSQQDAGGGAVGVREEPAPEPFYGETKIFNKYFKTLFNNKDYVPEDVFSLNAWINAVLPGSAQSQ